MSPHGRCDGAFDVPDVERALRRVAAYACERHIDLALGTCFMEPDEKCYNQIRFYRPDGAYLGFHSKILRYGSLKPPMQGEINHYAATPLQTFPGKQIVSWAVSSAMTFGPTRDARRCRTPI